MSNIGIQNVINQGLNLMQHSLTEEQYQIWLEYSKSMLALASKNQHIMINYMQVILSASNPILTPYQRISMCLRYLISIQSILWGKTYKSSQTLCLVKKFGYFCIRVVWQSRMQKIGAISKSPNRYQQLSTIAFSVCVSIRYGIIDYPVQR